MLHKSLLYLFRFLKKLYKFSTKKANSQLETSFKLVLESCLNSCYCSPLFVIILKDFFIFFSTYLMIIGKTVDQKWICFINRKSFLVAIAYKFQGSPLVQVQLLIWQNHSYDVFLKKLFILSQFCVCHGQSFFLIAAHLLSF